MILTATDLIAATLAELPPDLQAVAEAHFLDGCSVWAIMRERRMKKKEVESALDAALNGMRAALRSRGIRGLADVV